MATVPLLRRHGLAAPLLAALAVAGLAAACGGDGGGDAGAAGATRAEQVRDAARDARLPAEVADLLADAAGVVAQTFTVTYDLGGESGGTAVLTQDPPRRRVDLRARVDGDDVVRSLVTEGDESTVCERAAGRWTCGRDAGGGSAATPGAFDVDQIEAVIDDLDRARDAYEFRVARRTVAGASARCLVTELRPGREPTDEFGAKGTLCISPEGVPLLVETATASLRALRYSTSVDGDAFDLPAEVSS